jgi:hypothetical protein
LSKYSPSGKLLWEKQLYPEESTLYHVHNVSFDASGRIILSGLHQYNPDFIFARCFQPDGREVWHTKIPVDNVSKFLQYTGIAIINNKLTMFTAQNHLRPAQVGVIEIDMNGNVIRQSLTFKVDSVSVVPRILPSGEAIQFDNFNYKVNKIDRNGNIVWERTLHTNTLANYTRRCNAVVDEFSDMDIYAVGTFYRNNPYVGNMAITKLSKSGQIVWQQRYSQSDSLDAFALDIAFDQQYIYVTGGSTSTPKGAGFVTIYDKQSGQLVYNLKVASNTSELGNKILPISGGFIYRSQRDTRNIVIARYRLPTVTTTEAKTTNNITLYPNPTSRHLTIENIDTEQFNL